MKTKYFNLVLWKTFRCDSLVRRAVALLAMFSFTLNVLANPAGMSVQRGHATLSASGSQLTITAGNGAVLNWQSFNIAAGETTTFVQPSTGGIVWNRIGGQSASQIYGTLNANGVVILLNSSGFYFGPDSFVSAAGLVVSTANCVPPQNSGGSWEFNGPPPLASIVNYGTIKIGNGGDCFLIADKIENHGTITADGGNIGLAAGQTVTLSERPDGRGMSMNVTLPQGSVDNYGNLVADGGTIALNAKVVNQNGLIQANSVQNQNGVIELVADDSVNLGANSQILAQGDSSAGGSAGGNVTIQAGNTFSDTAGSSIVTAGGANGGNGGNVEISAPTIQSLDSTMNATAAAGFTGGEFLLDPVNIILGTSTAGGAINVNKAFAGFSTILLQATGNITVNGNTTWNLSTSTGNPTGTLTMEAGGNITFGNRSLLTDANNWSVTLEAGYSGGAVQSGTGSITFSGNSSLLTGAGDISLVAGQNITVGSGRVNTMGGGSISAHALLGNIDTGSDPQGYIFTSAGSAGQGYFIASSVGVGGISTCAGGDLNLTAGGNVTSALPAIQNNALGYVYDGNFISTSAMNGTAGSGAYGSQAGNVTIVAGGNVVGHYLVANGIGSIFAGVLMDANGNPLKDASGNYLLGATGSAGTSAANPNFALSLISGGWNVTAAQDIFLQEVRNPNGIFNDYQGSASYHGFDYAPNDYVNLTAGGQVQLGVPSTASLSLPRNGVQVPVIYPSILNVTAGAGGVVLTGNGDPIFNQLILYPSPVGSLTINTTGGGSLIGSQTTDGSVFYLIVSDGSAGQIYDGSQTFSAMYGLAAHADSPVHQGNSTPIALNISGDMDLMFLDVPEAAQINVVGNMNNCGFQGMNLNAADVTSITVGQAAKNNMENLGILNPATDGGLTVGGAIYNRGSFTTVDLSSVLSQPGEQAPDLSLLADAVNNKINGNFISASALLASLYYNPTTKQLTYQDLPGISVASVLQLLQNLTVQVYKNGVPQWADSPTDTVPLTTTVSVLDAASAQALLTLYNSLGTAPTGTLGYSIGGGGIFAFNAGSLDLGTTPGVTSYGVGLYQAGDTYPLAKLFNTGSDISINLTGDLTMFSSAIASLNGGNISIFAGGSINAGSADFTVNSTTARGIYTADQGSLSVIADGDINVNGSRIAAYDGGNVTVESLIGNVNCGSGGNGYVIVNDYNVDPSTHQVTTETPTIPGSGILATTFPSDTGLTVGNILVEAPNGTVSASAGGVVQLSLNGTQSPDAIVQLLAGLELHDVNGQVLSAANLTLPTIQGALITAAAGDSPDTVVITDGASPIKVQVSAAVWSQLTTVLNLAPAANQDLQLNLSGSGQSTLQTVLAGNGSGLANYNYATFVSAGQNIDASGSGVIGSNIKLNATGDILGVIFARNNLDINAQQNVGVTALSGGLASVSGQSLGSSTIIGVGGISVSGDASGTSLLSNNQVSGDTSGSKGMAQGTAANATSQGMASENTAAPSEAVTSSDDELNKKKKGISLAQKVSRVTVILPPKKLSEKTTGNNPL
jgi:filamentous hemagglutinin family protein